MLNSFEKKWLSDLRNNFHLLFISTKPIINHIGDCFKNSIGKINKYFLFQCKNNDICSSIDDAQGLKICWIWTDINQDRSNRTEVGVLRELESFIQTGEYISHGFCVIFFRGAKAYPEKDVPISIEQNQVQSLDILSSGSENHTYGRMYFRFNNMYSYLYGSSWMTS